MKLFGRILAILIAGVITVLTVQQVIRRAYHNFGKKYITLPGRGEEEETEN
jgi:hypothetical protein